MSHASHVLVTGSCGLIGSEVAVYFAKQGFRVTGIDSNHRAVFFGPGGDTRWVLGRLQREIPGYRHEPLDIPGAVHQATVVAAVAGGVSPPTQTVLGTTSVGAGVFLRDGGRGGREDDHGVHRKPEVGRR